VNPTRERHFGANPVSLSLKLSDRLGLDGMAPK
jgi:hypothetical protein